MTESEIQKEARHIYETRLAILNADDPAKEATEDQKQIAREEAAEYAQNLRDMNQ